MRRVKLGGGGKNRERKKGGWGGEGYYTFILNLNKTCKNVSESN